MDDVERPQADETPSIETEEEIDDMMETDEDTKPIGLLLINTYGITVDCIGHDLGVWT